MTKILIVEDDEALAEGLGAWLEGENYLVEVVNCGSEGRHRVWLYNYDVVILDWCLPGVSGLEICRELRGRGDLTPVLMITGKDSISEKEAGLDSGADDYVTKPFDAREVLARVRAILRRAGAQSSNVYRVADLMLDSATHEVRRGDVAVSLLPKEFAILEFLMRHINRVYSAKALLNRIWPSDSEVSEEAVRTAVMRLRRKIDFQGAAPLICTVYGVGYKIQEPSN
jgi:DNA-binding response OmpR family regulator